MFRFALNDGLVEATQPPGYPALDFLREAAGLKGVKHACREGDCGSCVILLGKLHQGAIRYSVVTSCLLPLRALAGRHVVTVEGLNRLELSPVQRLFAEEGASQCGFCTPGFVVSLTGYVLGTPKWEATAAEETIAGNICRCTGYQSIRRAITKIVQLLRDTVDPEEDRVPALVREGFIPEYFVRIGQQLEALEPIQWEKEPAPNQIVVAGGTDLYVQRPDAVSSANVFVVPPPAGPTIWAEGDHVYLAGGATAEDMKQSEVLTTTVGGVDRAMKLMGSLPIRNQATIGGNLVNASPIGDMSIILLALDAEIGLLHGGNRRNVPLSEFFLGYKTLNLDPGELVEWVRFPVVGDHRIFNFEKVSKRTHLDIASVNTAISLQLENGRIVSGVVSAGGVAPIPMRLAQTGAFLGGREPTLETAHGTAETARTEVSPISDVRGSAEYKSLLLGQLILAHFHVLFGFDKGLERQVVRNAG
ncbi:MAG: FAD binding domain-containing protein [Thermoanaerobaculales bacterium]